MVISSLTMVVSSFFITFGITVAALLLFFGMVGIKVILKPGSEFKKNCGNLDGGDGCSHCGRPSGDVCDQHNFGGCEDHRNDNQ